MTDILCNKALNTLDGSKPRGFCTGLFKHCGPHGNNLCTTCGIQTRPSRHAWCRDCQETDRRNKGVLPPLRQVPGKLWAFSCGCKTILPPRGGQSKFARWDGSPKHNTFAHYCRAAMIIRANTKDAARRGYTAVDQNTQHSIIYDLMNEKNCCRCHQPLIWEFGIAKTPHLHHDHKTGEIFGFTHPKCNPKAMEDEIKELRAEVRELKKLVGELNGY